MEIYDMLKIGKEMEVDPMFIMNARRRYLTSHLWDVQTEIHENIADVWSDDWDVALFIHSAYLTEAAQHMIKKELAIIDRLIFEHKNQITDEMIERARTTPIETIIEFVKGKTRCISPDHADNHPSAYYGKRTNRLMCPVCQKSWDAIACYQYAFSCDFIMAVKALQ